jgi:hypothetical protein
VLVEQRTNADGFAGVILGNEAILRPIDIFVGPGIVGCKNFTTVVIRGQPMTVHTSGLFKPAIANANIVGWGVKTGVAGAITEEFVQALGFCVDFQLMYS